MLCLIHCLILLTYWTPVLWGYVAEFNNSRLCYSDLENIGGFPKNYSYDVLYRMFGEGCTHIIGNLLLTDLYVDDNGRDPDLSFLQSIHEVTGYVIVMYSNVASIPLSNLRVIRAENGGYRIRDSLPPAALVVRRNLKGLFALRHIDFRNLRSIVQGSVYVYDNPGLCYWPRQINWTELFEAPGEQRVFGKQVVEDDGRQHDPHTELSVATGTSDCSNAADCSDKCSPFSDGRRYCWGSSQTDCQIESSCNRILCNRCYNASGRQICCHDQCLGGCTGPLATQCEACKEYNDSGTCVPHCFSQMRKEISSIHSSNTDTKYHLGNLCVTSCPLGFLIERDACVTHCTASETHSIGHTCQPCAGQCPKVCSLSYPTSKTGNSLKILTGNNLRDLINCTYLNGNLIITDQSFFNDQSLTTHTPIKQVEELWAMHSLREVTGYVYLDLKHFGSLLTNLSFLENLVKVGGSNSQLRFSLMVMNTAAEFPGLHSLRVVPHGGVIFLNNSRLCYVSTLPWFNNNAYNETHQKSTKPMNCAQVTGTLNIISEGHMDHATCTQMGNTCHSACDINCGCWGPGPYQCVRCAQRRVGAHDCVMSCDEKPGYMSEHMSTWNQENVDHEEPHSAWVDEHLLGSPDADHVCVPCHPECRHTCTGPGAHECVGDCKTAWANGRCVSHCDQQSYLNTDRRICEPCQSHCHQRQHTHQSVCTGPGRYPGKGGCNKCEKLLLLSSFGNKISNHGYQPLQEPLPLLCLRGECPPRTYLTTEIVKPESAFAHVAETFTSLLPVCQSCHPLCSSCSAYSVLEAGPNRLGCIVCLGSWFRETCVESCPERDTYTMLQQQSSLSTRQYPSHFKHFNINDIAMGVQRSTVHVRQLNGRCLSCHHECHSGCWGPEPSQCNHCLHVRVHLSLVPARVLNNHPDLESRLHVASNTTATQQAKTHEVFGPFLCLPVCPIELKFLISDPSSNDKLCHSTSMLTGKEQHQISLDNSLYLSVLNPAFTTTNKLNAKSHASNTVLWFVIIVSIGIILGVLCCCFYRARKARVNKTQYGTTTVSLLCPYFDGWQGGSKMAPEEDTVVLSNKFIGKNYLHQNTLAYHQNDQDHRCHEKSMPHEGPTAKRNAKAPNLGRLIMIQLDDLILDEQHGPLGTGAFGAVYRGVWKISEHEETAVHTSASSFDMRSDSLHSTATISTHMPSGSVEYEANMKDLGAHQQNSPVPIPPQPTAEVNNSNTFKETRSQSKYKTVQVAVKILNDVRGSSDLDALLDEAKVMASVSHKHCLPLLGVCLSQSRKCLVSAYVNNGSLERYLRSQGRDLPCALLIKWSEQIADGMAYLQSRDIIHRDLATRNVLVTTRDHLQITDFGLAKMLEGEEESKRGEVIVRSGRVPIRWLAIETLMHGRYSFKTDVWAYGVTIWEIFTFGQKPYDHVETGNVKAHILSGNRLPQPEICSLELYQIMLACWHGNPQERPNFNTLLEMFRNFMKHPEFYVHQISITSQTIGDTDGSLGVDTRSRLTIYPGSQLSSDRPENFRSLVSVPVSQNPVSPCQLSSQGNLGSVGSGILLTHRRLDPRRRLRASLLIPSAQSLQFGRFAKFSQQKRQSTGCRTENGTLSTSLSITSSGLSDRWSHSAFPHHSHPRLAEVREAFPVTVEQTQVVASATSYPHNDSRVTSMPLNRDTINADSWASSGQPLISSDQDSSLSQLMLSNLGYTSSDSHNSMNNQTVQHTNATSCLVHTNTQVQYQSDTFTQTLQPIRSGIFVDGLTNTMPSDFELEAAAGYVWPQWPSAFSETQPLNSDDTNMAEENNLAHLNRQLWLRRSARQRLYYLRQSQFHRAALGTVLPEHATEDAIEEETSTWRQRLAALDESVRADDSDAEDLDDRYCPDPTSDAGSAVHLRRQ